MKEIFELKRFGKYVSYDLAHAWEKYGFSLLLTGFLPVILYVILMILRLIFNQEVSGDGQLYQMLPFFIILGVVMSFGSKVYGEVTERKAGSSWIALPASALEKTLSLLLITCVLLPACLLALLWLSHTILSLFRPDLGSFLYGFDSLYSGIAADGESYFNTPLVIWLGWVVTILIFTLGALCFKKNKVGKTILCIFAFGVLLSILAMLFFKRTYFSSDDFERLFGDFTPEKAELWINTILNIFYTVVIGGLIAGILARIKTIKA